MNPASLPILTYHAIDDSGAITATSPSWFAATIEALDGSGLRAIDLGEWVARGRPPAEGGYAIAFDDGLASILRVADVLSRRSIPATVFLVADRIGRDNAWPGQPRGIPRARLLDRAEILDLAARGFRFGSHGRTHARLDRMDRSEVAGELVGSRDRIEQVVGRPCPLLAYPHGASDARVRALAAGIYESAFGTRLSYASSGDDPHDIARIDAFYLRSPRSLASLAGGRWHPYLAVRRALRAARRAVA